MGDVLIGEITQHTVGAIHESPAGDRRSPLRIKKLRSKQIISPDRF